MRRLHRRPPRASPARQALKASSRAHDAELPRPSRAPVRLVRSAVQAARTPAVTEAKQQTQRWRRITTVPQRRSYCTSEVRLYCRCLVGKAVLTLNDSSCGMRTVFPWILVLGLLFLVVRMQSSLATIEQTLVLASAKMDAIESRLAALSAACPATPT